MGIFTKKCIGVDVGAASIKVVEISRSGKKRKLENYAEFNLSPDEASIRTFQSKNMLLISKNASEVLRAVMKKAGISQKEAAFSIPDFSTFFTTFTLPPMTESEVSKAIKFEARHYIPLPLEEVAYDWKIVEKKEVSPGVKLKVLLVAVPKNVLERYNKMINLANLNLKGMEAEVFGLIRVTRESEKRFPFCLVDIGWQSATISIVEKNGLQASHSFDVSGNKLTKIIAEKLDIGLNEAEDLKKKNGLDKDSEVGEIILKEISALSGGIRKMIENYENGNGKKINSIILAGGSAKMTGLIEYIKNSVGIEVKIVDAFSSMEYPEKLAQRLRVLSPSFAVAAGTAIMGLDS